MTPRPSVSGSFCLGITFLSCLCISALPIVTQYSRALAEVKKTTTAVTGYITQSLYIFLSSNGFTDKLELSVPPNERNLSSWNRYRATNWRKTASGWPGRSGEQRPIRVPAPRRRRWCPSQAVGGTPAQSEWLPIIFITLTNLFAPNR